MPCKTYVAHGRRTPKEQGKDRQKFYATSTLQRFWPELGPGTTWNSPRFCYNLITASPQLLPGWSEDQNQLRALTRCSGLTLHFAHALHWSHCPHQNGYFSLFKERKHPHLLYLDAGHLKKESPLKIAWMNLLNGKPLPARLDDFSCRDVFAIFSSESHRKGLGEKLVSFLMHAPIINSFVKSEEQTLPSQ